MENYEQEEKTIKLSTLFKYLWKNIILFAAVVVGVLVIGCVYSFAIAKPVYKSSATVELQITGSNDKTDYVNTFRITETVATLVKQDSVLGAVAEENQVDKNQLSKLVSISYAELNYYLTISVKGSNPQQTEKLTNALVLKLVEVAPNSAAQCNVIPSTAAEEGVDVSSSKLTTVIISGVLGLALGCVVVAIKVLATKKYIGREQIEERLSTKVLGYFPIDKEKKKQNKANNVVNEEVELLACNVKNYEPYNALLNNLKYHYVEKSERAIMFASSAENELKNTIICNLANCIAYNGQKVVLLDLDMRNPAVHKVYNLSQEMGVVDYLNGDCAFDDVIKHTDAGVDVITAGKNIINPMAVISSKSLPVFIQKLKDKYEFVLINSSPVLSCADAVALAPICDGVLFNIAMADVHKKMAENAVESLKMGGANIIGINVTKGTEDKFDGKYYDGNPVYTKAYSVKSEVIAEAAAADDSNKKN